MPVYGQPLYSGGTMDQQINRRNRRPLALLMLLIFISHSATAASVRGGDGKSSTGDDMSRRYIAQISLLKQEIAKNSATLEERDAQLEEITGTLESTEQSLAQAEATGAKLRSRLEQAIERIQHTDERLQQTQNKLSGTRHQLNVMTHSKTDLEELSLLQKGELLTCEEKNLALYRVNRELTAQYEAKGVLTGILQREPVTGLKQVQIENIIEEYRNKLDQQIYQAPAAALELPAEPKFSEF